MTKLNLYLTKKMKKMQISHLRRRYKDDKETFALKKWLDRINSYSDIVTQESCVGHIQGFDRKFCSDAFLSIIVTERLGKFIENNIEKLLTSQYSYGGSAYHAVFMKLPKDW